MDLTKFDFKVFGCYEGHVRALATAMGHQTRPLEFVARPGMIVYNSVGQRRLVISKACYLTFKLSPPDGSILVLELEGNTGNVTSYPNYYSEKESKGIKYNKYEG